MSPLCQFTIYPMQNVSYCLDNDVKVQEALYIRMINLCHGAYDFGNIGLN